MHDFADFILRLKELLLLQEEWLAWILKRELFVISVCSQDNPLKSLAASLSGSCRTVRPMGVVSSGRRTSA